MRNPVYSTQFRRDLKKVEQRGYDLEKLKVVMRILLNEEELPPEYKDHPLKGIWKKHRDLHIAPDWLLIYKIEKIVFFPEQGLMRIFFLCKSMLSSYCCAPTMRA